MISPNNKWLIHTLLVGLIPILTRLMTWATTSGGKVEALAAPDFITLGLVIHVSIINEMEHAQRITPESKALLNGICLVFITLFGALYALAAISEHHGELIDVSLVLRSSIGFCVGSTVLGLSLFQRFAKGARDDIL
jgi:hypothetical protein